MDQGTNGLSDNDFQDPAEERSAFDILDQWAADNAAAPAEEVQAPKPVRPAPTPPPTPAEEDPRASASGAPPARPSVPPPAHDEPAIPVDRPAPSGLDLRIVPDEPGAAMEPPTEEPESRPLPDLQIVPEGPESTPDREPAIPSSSADELHIVHDGDDEVGNWLDRGEPDHLRERLDLDTGGDAGPSLLDPGDSLPLASHDLSFPEEIAAPVFADDDEEEAAAPRGEASDTPEVRLVRALASTLAKAVKASRMYPLDNPICRKFAGELGVSFGDAFELLEEIRLGVGKTKFYFRGEEVLHQPGREESVPGRFFWDGVREVTFRRGLNERELTDFLGLCRRNQETAQEGEDDLVTLFWQRQFEYISYIAVDDILDLENPDDPVPEEFGTAYMNFVDLDMHNLEEEAEAQDEAISEMASEIQRRLREDEVNLFGVPAAERDALLDEMAEEEGSRLFTDILVIIEETLFLDHDETSFNATVEVVGSALSELIIDGRLIVAGGLMRTLNELLSEHSGLTDGMREALEHSLAIGFSQTSLDALVTHLNSGSPDTVRSLDDFLGLLPGRATASLCGLLPRVEDARARTKLIQALTRRARLGVDVFLPYLRDPNPATVEDVCLVLGGTGNQKAIQPLRGLMRHPDIDVRCAALDALCKLGPARSSDVLLAALEDANPRIRLAAVQSLGEAGRVALPSLIAIVEDRRFAERDGREKRAFFRAVGMAGGESVVVWLEAYLVKKGMFRRGGQDDDIRAAACEALGHAGGRKAKRLLEEHVEDKVPEVRKAAQAALERLHGFDDDAREAA